jgi:hypothetical protein
MAEAIAGGENADAVQNATQDAVAAAHAELLREPGLQFDFPDFVRPEPPAWWQTVLEFLSALAPIFQILLWTGIAIGAAAILYTIVNAVYSRRAEKLEVLPESHPRRGEDWRPPEVAVRELLGDVDELAARGRFADAAHLLLYRSIGEILDWEPDLLRPSLTSRDIAGLEALPQRARDAFDRIARIVERSFFGGREVGAAEFDECRRAYADFALPKAAA